ncbi:MAG: RsmD family RNA methyltransferase [Bacteriovoracaceae bacterium]|nr:RsmD family RNA methyltransferase [Bacteriovoracaceae bacterium]
MSIRILGGLAKGRSLFVPKGDQTRPTSVLLKRRIFDSLQDLSEYHFIDLCAGSGSVGLEAWSRGAKSVKFIENHPLALKSLEKNIGDFKNSFVSEVSERPLIISKQGVEKWPAHFKSEGPTIVFFDPPYESHHLYKKLMPPILENPSISQLWIESDRQKGLASTYWDALGHKPDKLFEQGTSYLAVFRFN